jgi:hypothetical protein
VLRRLFSRGEYCLVAVGIEHGESHLDGQIHGATILECQSFELQTNCGPELTQIDGHRVGTVLLVGIQPIARGCAPIRKELAPTE